ncbi:MAG TPA: hypothetical protein PKE31_01280 [Pseudomonadota bacterium]|nr:hypothetical protein [Pseudomonadota bacterium]
MASGEKRFEPAEVRDILRRAQQRDRALSRQSETAGLTAQELLENAKELGFSGQDMQQALAEFEADREELTAQQEIRQLAYRRLSTHAVVYVSILALLTATSAWSVGLPLLIPAILWGMLLLFQLRGTLFPDPDKLREQAKQRILTQKLKTSGKQFGTALATGAAKLLELSAKKIDAGVKQLDK